jgi:hypothetical protein
MILGGIAASAQAVSFGVIGGVTLTDPLSYRDESRPYIVGGSIEVRRRRVSRLKPMSCISALAPVPLSPGSLLQPSHRLPTASAETPGNFQSSGSITSGHGHRRGSHSLRPGMPSALSGSMTTPMRQSWTRAAPAATPHSTTTTETVLESGPFSRQASASIPGASHSRLKSDTRAGATARTTQLRYGRTKPVSCSGSVSKRDRGQIARGPETFQASASNSLQNGFRTKSPSHAWPLARSSVHSRLHPDAMALRRIIASQKETFFARCS